MKIMVIGHARHGKDTVGEYFRDRYGMKFSSSSMFCAAKIMLPAFAKKAAESCQIQGMEKVAAIHPAWPNYITALECYDDRHRFRSFWHDQICAYVLGDQARLAREILEVNDVYCGCRNEREFMTARNAGVFTLSIWVDRSRHLPKEPVESMKLKPWMADFWLDNNGTLFELHNNIDSLMGNIYPNI